MCFSSASSIDLKNILCCLKDTSHTLSLFGHAQNAVFNVENAAMRSQDQYNVYYTPLQYITIFGCNIRYIVTYYVLVTFVMLV